MHGARRAAFLGLSSKNSGLCPYNGEDLPLCAAAKIKFSGVTKAR